RSTKGFRVTLGNKGSQAAEMVLAPGDKEGDAKNRHRGSDQWLYVVSGTGAARVNGKRYALRAGSVMLIEHGDEHEIRNTGEDKLVTLNIYVPPAYDGSGEPLPRGRR
ncbi:MAG TPA: cupin domain-containing protein, partial [Burkholderiales bacterium]|nr:cupin domain-containing protein [Burkholderiales bacterium]